MSAQCHQKFFIQNAAQKNITLNRKKAEGSEKLAAGDVIQMFFADETYEKFAGTDIKADTDSKIQTDTGRQNVHSIHRAKCLKVQADR